MNLFHFRQQITTHFPYIRLPSVVLDQNYISQVNISHEIAFPGILALGGTWLANIRMQSLAC